MSRTGAFLVTGAGSGIGFSIAENLIANGNVVFTLGRDRDKLDAAAKTLGPKVFHFFKADLANSRSIREATEAIRLWLQSNSLPLLGIVNNAGIYDFGAFAQTTDEVWERQFKTNLLSAVHLTRELYPELKAAAPSSVLNISSTLGLRPVSGTSAYSALKAAMVNWTHTLALEWAAQKIRVNCICPGLVQTPIHGNRELSAEAQPLGRVGQPEDIARAAGFLLSSDSDWITGAVLPVDGGIHL